jgi:hypothetical protein
VLELLPGELDLMARIDHPALRAMRGVQMVGGELVDGMAPRAGAIRLPIF